MGVRKIAPGKKASRNILLRKKPPENCPLGKSLIDFNGEYRGKLYRKPCNFYAIFKATINTK